MGSTSSKDEPTHDGRSPAGFAATRPTRLLSTQEANPLDVVLQSPELCPEAGPCPNEVERPEARERRLTTVGAGIPADTSRASTGPHAAPSP